MKKILTIIFCLLGIAPSLIAAHIKGGELFYKYIGPGHSNGTSQYLITLKLYIDCGATSPGQLDPSVALTVYNKVTSAQVVNATAGLTDESMLRFDPRSNPCIGNPPLDVCYRVRTYSMTVTLEDIPDGYVIAFQRCCRIIDIRNLAAPSNSFGATYLAEIPGTSLPHEAYKNSSPTYMTNDAAAICRSSAFTFSFAASEIDGDSLVYSLCSGFVGASQSNPSPTSATPPPYSELSYSGGYSGGQPMGASVSINSQTGLVTGVAPFQLGQYVITACTYEYRRGVLINIHRKDIHIAVSDCVPLRALLKPDYSFCDDFLVTFANEQVNPPGSVYTWDFGDNTPLESTQDPSGRMQHQYADTGTYTVKLRIVLAGQCIDSTTTLAKVYPGFFPGFTTNGSCLYTPFQFTDTSRARYGMVNRWRWDFGDETTSADTSIARSPTWLYNSLGLKRVRFIAESDKGCIDTVFRDIEVRDIPLMNVAFRDTLICSIDSLQLQVSGNGNFSWSPNANMLNATNPNPIVYPKSTTTYTVSLDENGCVNTDTVRVRVVDFVTLDAGADTTICLTDSITLRPASDGLRYNWSPAVGLSNANVKNPLAYPASTTTYTVESIIGKCNAVDNITIRTVPYPQSFAGADTTICYLDSAQLHGSIVGSSFEWKPANSLVRPNTLSPTAVPRFSTTYMLLAYDTLGCPKPGIDEIQVTVRQKINAFAGNDTVVVVGQPLMLSGEGAEFFEWTPPFNLDQPSARTPVATLSEDESYVLKAYTAEGCFGLDTINVRVFKTQPDIFVPNAFAPEGSNRILRPIAPGISSLHYFRVYNRWGQLVFQTTELGRGWDGTIAGRVQDSGTYVWMVSGRDFTGKTVTRKGTATLIR